MNFIVDLAVQKFAPGAAAAAPLASNRTVLRRTASGRCFVELARPSFVIKVTWLGVHHINHRERHLETCKEKDDKFVTPVPMEGGSRCK